MSPPKLSSVDVLRIARGKGYIRVKRDDARVLKLVEKHIQDGSLNEGKASKGQRTFYPKSRVEMKR